ncbi:DUF3800 domain-containing protein [Paeniglutamicibacter sp. ZC-3]|uniref:DUF3800 domain-containing protein n=1 Tax=Paeniglutamicibacter sp. ZC-3 TaxID=2986919 RepID=UPI0021F7F97E|nr:DUF3800 domain-containing protein [Paeniglutamicibacter sp. ZC-3]MCV9996529.1 DUF3800 domain-containing protein [Paeniglutamicibacter sp. ZC-3]
MTQDSTVAEIYFDESGHDGENLMGGTTTVFAHGSVHMEVAEASDLVAYLRKKTRAQGEELKAKTVINSGRGLLNELYGPGGKLVGKTQIYLVEKTYHAVGKIIDMLIEEEAYKRGVNLYAHGRAKQLAHDLYQYGPRALGPDGWDELVSGFTSMMRSKQRKGVKETVDGFYEKVDKYRLTSRREKVSKVLGMLWETREHAEEFQSDLEEGIEMRALDPLETSLFQLALEWHSRIKRPISIFHDEQTALTKPMLERILLVANHGIPPGFGMSSQKIELVDIKHVDSKSDPRIQLADISAGFCRQMAEDALRGEAQEEGLEMIRHMVHFNSLWGDSKSWEMIRPRV